MGKAENSHLDNERHWEQYCGNKDEKKKLLSSQALHSMADIGATHCSQIGADRWLIAGSTAMKSQAINAGLRRIKDGVRIAETHLNALWERGPLLDAAISKDEKKLISLHGNPRRDETTMITDNNTAGCLQIWKFPDGKPGGSRIELNAEPRSVVLNSERGQAAVLLANSDSHPSLGVDGSLQSSVDGSMLIAWGTGLGFKVWNWETKQPKFRPTMRIPGRSTICLSLLPRI